MKTIWKYELEITDKQIIDIPLKAQILTVQVQYDKPCIWCLVDPEAPKASHIINIFGTGHPIFTGEDSEYIGTFQLYSGKAVFHVFDEGVV